MYDFYVTFLGPGNRFSTEADSHTTLLFSCRGLCTDPDKVAPTLVTLRKILDPYVVSRLRLIRVEEKKKRDFPSENKDYLSESTIKKSSISFNMKITTLFLIFSFCTEKEG